MKDVEKFLDENQVLVIEFKREFSDYVHSIENYGSKGRKKAIFKYWKEAIRLCEDNGQKSNWAKLELFFETMGIADENQITEQQYESIING